MSEPVLFAETIRKTHAWLGEVAGVLGKGDAHRAYHVLRAVLHVLRDRLTVAEAADLGSELPLLLRGAFFDGWKPSGTPERERTKEQFLDRVKANLDDPDVDPETATRAVFAVLERHVSRGELAHVRESLPSPIRELWNPPAPS